MKNKKMIITFILIAILLIVAIAVNVIAIKGKKTNNENNTNLSSEVENNVDKNIASEEDLELNGDKYIAGNVKDADDNDVTVDTNENTPMILVFWNTSEEKSIEALNAVQTYYEEYKDKITFNCVAVIDGVSETKEEIEEFISQNNITMPVVYDTTENSLTIANNITKIPTILMVDKKAEIINTLTDEINEDIIEANLDILAENY